MASARRPLSPAIRAGISALVLVVVGSAILVPVLVHQARKRADERYWLENYDRILSLKAEAERLAIAGKFAEAHAAYQRIERIVGGRTPSDPRLWDLTERAKQDQDRVFAILMDAQAARLAAGASPPTAPPPQYRGLAQGNAQPPETPSNSLRNWLGAAGRALATTPATQPVVAVAPEVRPRAIEPPANAAPALEPRPQAPAARPLPPGGELTDEAIGQAIRRGADFLLKHFEADQLAIAGRNNDTYLEGLNALCVYALLQAGQATQDPRLDIRGPLARGMIARMKAHMYALERGNPVAPVTYARSLRTLALSVYNRPEDRQALAEDLQWLILASTDGCYTYDDEAGRIFGNRGPSRFIAPPRDGRTLYYLDPDERPGTVLQHNGESRVPVIPPNRLLPERQYRGGSYNARLFDLYKNRLYTEAPQAPWDNSNTQYGHMAVWAAVEAGYEVPMDYWLAAEKHWITCQTETGQWFYKPSSTKPTYAMTVAGLASLFITHDYLDAPSLGAEVGRNPYSEALARGLAWLEQGNNCLDVSAGGMQYLGYNLFGLERVGLASGFKYFGAHDWYRELAVRTLALQRPDGAWCRDLAEGEDPDAPNAAADAIIDTAYMILFLARGRHPVMMNKLRFEGYWNNRAREIANLSKFTGVELERPLNWQIVSLQSEWHDWMDAPILYIASHQAPRFRPEQIQKLRAFAEAGGLIFTHADAGASPFNSFVPGFAKALFPDYELTNLPTTHELYSLQYRIQDKPPLKVISNGSRLLLVHSPTDLSTPWQVRNGNKREAWQMAINLFLYAAGKADFRNRLNSPFIAPIPGCPASSLRLARLKYPGSWNPEPFAFERFARYFRRQTSIGLELATVEPRELKPQTAPVAHLTGNAPWTAADADAQAIRAYVESGGILLIDSTGGSQSFSQSVVALLEKLAPGRKPVTMDFKHRLFTAASPGMDDLTRPLLRPYAKTPAQVQSLAIGKGRVIVTPLDLTTGLLGTNTWCISGYHPDYAQKLVKNLLLWVANGVKD